MIHVQKQIKKHIRFGKLDSKSLFFIFFISDVQIFLHGFSTFSETRSTTPIGSLGSNGPTGPFGPLGPIGLIGSLSPLRQLGIVGPCKLFWALLSPKTKLKIKNFEHQI